MTPPDVPFRSEDESAAALAAERREDIGAFARTAAVILAFGLMLWVAAVWGFGGHF